MNDEAGRIIMKDEALVRKGTPFAFCVSDRGVLELLQSAHGIHQWCGELPCQTVRRHGVSDGDAKEDAGQLHGVTLQDEGPRNGWLVRTATMRSVKRPPAALLLVVI